VVEVVEEHQEEMEQSLLQMELVHLEEEVEMGQHIQYLG